LNIPLTESPSLVRPALTLAQAHHRSVYDCLYLALSLKLGCVLASSDKKASRGITLVA
jgi:predicted nucleic acid-binding protein